MQKNTITPAFTCLPEDPQMRRPWQANLNLFFSLPFCANIFYRRLKGKKEEIIRRKRKENLPEMKNCNPAFVEILQAQSAAPPPWSRPLCFPAKGLESCWKTFSAVLRLTSDRAPWCPNLGEFKWQAWLYKWGIFFYNRTAWLLHDRGAKEEESKFSSNPQWCHWPVRRLWPTPVNPCKSDASNLWCWLEHHTFKFRKQP